MNNRMKYNFIFYRTEGDGRLLVSTNNLSTVGATLVNYCEDQRLDLIQLRVIDCPELRELFAHHLAQRKFSLMEMRETADGPVTEVNLVYKRSGWTLGPSAVNNWGRA